MTNNLPLHDHIARYVAYRRLRFDENQRAIGIIGEAFRRRPDEDGLSVTWVEAFPGSGDTQRWAAVSAIRATISVGKQSGFAWAIVGAIHDACESRGAKVRIVHAPEDGNPGHSEIRQLPRDDEILLDLLASEVFADWVLNSDVP